MVCMVKSHLFIIKKSLAILVIQICSGITGGRVLSGELYAQRFQKLIYLHLLTDCFMKISPQSSEQIQFYICICSDD